MRSIRSTTLKLLVASSLLLGVPAVQADYPLAVEHAQGSVTLQQAPKKVAVFDLATLDTLAALGVEVAGVPQQVGPAHLQLYRGDSYTQVGTVFEPDYAALQALQPDLIIIAGRSRSAHDQLSELAPTIDLTSATTGSFVDGLRSNLQRLGEIFEREAEAAKLDEQLQQTLAEVQQKTQGLSSLTLFTINGRIATHAPGERFGMLYELLGTSATAEAGEVMSRDARPEPGSAEAQRLQEAQRARLEQALAKQPDWLVVLDRGAATGGEGQARETLGQDAAVAASKAWQEGRVYYLEPATWYTATGGYQGVMTTLKEFAEAL